MWRSKKNPWNAGCFIFNLCTTVVLLLSGVQLRIYFCFSAVNEVITPTNVRKVTWPSSRTLLHIITRSHRHMTWRRRSSSSNTRYLQWQCLLLSNFISSHRTCYMNMKLVYIKKTGVLFEWNNTSTAIQLGSIADDMFRQDFVGF